MTHATDTTHARRALLAAALLLVLAVLLSAAPDPADAARKRPCTRGGATLEAASKSVRVVRVRMRRESRHETRREHLLACWRATGRRVTVAREVDHGLDNRASTRIEIVGDRYVGVIATNEGGISISTVARVVDARTRRRVHDSAECEKVDQGDLSGVQDVVFLRNGGMAMSCERLLLFRGPGPRLETIEPPGTNVPQVGVSQHNESFTQRLFWIVRTDDGDVTRSLAL